MERRALNMASSSQPGDVPVAVEILSERWLLKVESEARTPPQSQQRADSFFREIPSQRSKRPGMKGSKSRPKQTFGALWARADSYLRLNRRSAACALTRRLLSREHAF